MTKRIKNLSLNGEIFVLGEKQGTDSFAGSTTIVNGAILPNKSVAIGSVTSGLSLSLRGAIPDGRSIKVILVKDTKPVGYAVRLVDLMGPDVLLTGATDKVTQGAIYLDMPNQILVMIITQAGTKRLIEIQ